jgi:hypothetical protein
MKLGQDCYIARDGEGLGNIVGSKGHTDRCYLGPIVGAAVGLAVGSFEHPDYGSSSGMQ